MFDRIIQDYNEAVLDTSREKALAVIHEALNQGVSPEDIEFKIVIPSIDMIIRLADKGDANLAQHFMASQIAATVTEELIPRFKKVQEVMGCVVIGTCRGDFHGLGKKIVSGCLKVFMIDVVDLGLNVEPERFVEEAVAHNAQVIGISSMMVHTARGENGCLKVRRLLKERGLEDKIKIAVGGAPYRYDHELY
ncbi:MAG: cobalamin-dependent protein, partial [Candidatus Omnitrophica bacterium]|nr:cobalamin-dependent protein [Candidatus Omnitrophota bacterium]